MGGWGKIQSPVPIPQPPGYPNDRKNHRIFRKKPHHHPDDLCHDHRRGGVGRLKTPVDAIPDLSDNQVIVFTDYPGRSPQVVEDQITYPLAVNLQGLPKVKAVRASSAFGFSMIYVIFEDKVDIYWARTRVLERLNYAASLLPPGVSADSGP